MISYFYKSLRSQTMQEAADFKRGTWVYAESPTLNEQDQLIKRFNLEAGHVQDALDEDEMPRLEREGEQIYIFVRFAYRDGRGEVMTAPLLIIFGGEYVITVSNVPLPAIERFRSSRFSFATTQRAKLVLQILSAISDDYDTFINQTSRKIKAIRSRLRGQGITNQDFIDFATIEDELNEFLGSLQPNNATLRRLMVGRHIPLYEDDQDLVEDLMLNNEQSIEASRSNLQSIDNIRGAYSAISANNLNRTIVILTVATVLLALPNLFFGMYGMNVPLPFEHRAWAFTAIVTSVITLIAVLGVVARKKRIL